MTSEQYRRANTTVYPIIVGVYAYLFLIMLSLCITAGGTVVTYVQMGFTIMTMIVSTIFFVTMRDTKLCGVMILISASVSYAVMVLISNNDESFAYAFPILFASMAYLNIRLVVGGNLVILFANIAKLILKGTPENKQSLFLVVLISVVIFFASVRIIKLLILNNKENIEAISEGARLQEENMAKMSQVADDISTLFGEAMEMTNRLDNSVYTSNFSMCNIVDSTESTAEAIQAQASMCADIQKQTDIAEKETMSMILASEQTRKNISEGASMVNELKGQAGIVEEASNITVEVMNSLSEKVAEVEGFVGTILDISSETNLLALNASIEAARAGEAGRGFAVVADQIRQLSEQTNTASNNITSIISELNNDTKRASGSIQNSVNSVNRQNQLIEETKAIFDRITRGVDNLSDNINNTERVIKGILQSTGVISENITSLSATSEEVAASSTEGLKNTEATVEDMRRCREIIEQIYALSQQLQE